MAFAQVERLCRGQRHTSPCGEVGTDSAQLSIAARQNNDVCIPIASLPDKGLYRVRYATIDGLLDVGVTYVGLAHKVQLHTSAHLLAHPLTQFLVSLRPHPSIRIATHIEFLHQRVVGIHVARQPSEEHIVEFHYRRCGAVVGVEPHQAVVALYAQGVSVVFHTHHPRQPCKLAHVALPEAVYGLLAIAHHQRTTALAHPVLQQRHQVVPLHHRRVLKLVYQEVAIAVSEALVDEWSRVVLVLNHTVYQAIEVAQVHHLVVAGIAAHLPVQQSQQGHGV